METTKHTKIKDPSVAGPKYCSLYAGEILLPQNHIKIDEILGKRVLTYREILGIKGNS